MKQLEEMTMKELYELARKYDIARYTAMRKQDLIFEILEAKAKSEGYFFGEGVLEIAPDGYGFLRSLETMLSGPKDIYLSQSQIRKFNLNTGDIISGVIRPPKEGERFNAMIKIEAINYKSPELADERVNFENLTPDYPKERYVLETEKETYSTRLIDLFAPIGKGQRGMIVAPPKAGKTTILKEMA
ncbi:MAG: Rho termination factor N-terminal domain-containing protein, partial [Fervidobacterium sp.]|nr:Rho termination factor N-terminal domain-containing protein [Fervidobacterium sp.]